MADTLTWRCKLNLSARIAGVFFATSVLFGNGAAEAQDLTQAEANEIAVEAYLYLYPLITMDLTRRQLISIEPGPGSMGGYENWFRNISAYPTADEKSVVRPNFDTLYSSTFLDLTKEPMIVSAPDTKGRYYLLPMLDMWTDVFASPGSRTTGTKAGTFLVTGPGWEPENGKELGDDFAKQFGLPEETQLIASPTNHVWIIGRTKTDGPSDYEAVHEIQAGYKVTPLSKWGQELPEPVFSPDPTVDTKTPPKKQVDTMAGKDYFTYGAELLKVEPPHITDQPILSRMARLGFREGESFDFEAASPLVQSALKDAPVTAQKLMAWKSPRIANFANQWSMDVDTVGVYGTYYLKRALMAQLGLGANLPADAVYPIAMTDGDGNPLTGTNDYVLHFDAGDLPPVNAFWSVTIYDNDGYQVANSLNRFALSSWMPMQKNPDGSLDLYFQHESPGKDKEANWLPAPDGPFNVTMRLYAPKPQVLIGKWAPPAINKAEKLSVHTAQ
ncbi:DUF1254 domain-containing protein [Labrenzia sp. MBR-25]